MWWKLTLIGLIAVALVVAVQPIHTHAIKIYIPPTGEVPRPPRQSVIDLLSNMYVTPSSLLISLVIVGIASFFAYRVIKG